MRCFDGIYDHPRCRREHAALIPLATECLMQKTSYIALVMIAAATAAGAQPASIVDDAGTLHLPDGEKIPYSDLASDQARRNFIDITRGYDALVRSDERRVGKECVSRGSSRWSPYHKKKK